MPVSIAARAARRRLQVGMRAVAACRAGPARSGNRGPRRADRRTLPAAGSPAGTRRRRAARRPAPARSIALRRRRRRGTRRTRDDPRDCLDSAHASKYVDCPTKASRSAAPSRGTGYGPLPQPTIGPADIGVRMLAGAGGTDLLTRAECTLRAHGMAGAHHRRDASVDPDRARAALRAGRADRPLGRHVARPRLRRRRRRRGALPAKAGAQRAVLVDASADALAEAARDVPAGETDAGAPPTSRATTDSTRYAPRSATRAAASPPASR